MSCWLCLAPFIKPPVDAWRQHLLSPSISHSTYQGKGYAPDRCAQLGIEMGVWCLLCMCTVQCAQPQTLAEVIEFVAFAPQDAEQSCADPPVNRPQLDLGIVTQCDEQVSPDSDKASHSDHILHVLVCHVNLLDYRSIRTSKRTADGECSLTVVLVHSSSCSCTAGRLLMIKNCGVLSARCLYLKHCGAPVVPTHECTYLCSKIGSKDALLSASMSRCRCGIYCTFNKFKVQVHRCKA